MNGCKDLKRVNLFMKEKARHRNGNYLLGECLATDANEHVHGMPNRWPGKAHTTLYTSLSRDANKI